MADLNVIICPECDCEIPITEALSHQIEDKFKKEFDKKARDLEEKSRQLQEQQEQQAKAFDEKLNKALSDKETELKEISRKYLVEQKEKMKEEALREAKDRLNLELEDLKKQNDERGKSPTVPMPS